MKYAYTLFILAFAVVACAPDQIISHEDMDMHVGHHTMAPITSEEEFLVEMIPHHQEAVDTSIIIYQNTQNEALRDLARRIIDAQEEEIQMMQTWLDEDFGGGFEASYENMMPDLEQYSGVNQDNAYIHGMIMHHLMAVEMAEEVLALNPSERVRVFAEEVIAVQSAEIEEMYGLMRH